MDVLAWPGTVRESVQPLTFRRSGRSAATASGIALGGVVLQAMGFARARSRLEGPPEFMLVAVLVSGTFACLLAGFYFVYRLTSSKPILIISEEGIVDRSSLVGVGLIRWQEIIGVEPFFVGSQLFITVRTTDPEAVVARQRSPIKRWILRMSDRKGWGVAVITTNMLPVPAEDVLQAIRERLPAA